MKKDFKPLSCHICYTSRLLFESFFIHMLLSTGDLEEMGFAHEIVKADDSVKI